jgi:hypothetical protein
LLDELLKKYEGIELNDIQRGTLLLLKDDSHQGYYDHRKLEAKIDYRLQPDTPVGMALQDDFGKSVVSFIDAINDETVKQYWIALINFCIETGEKSAPPKKWKEPARKHLGAVGEEAFAASLIEWLAIVRDIIQAIHKNETGSFLADINHTILLKNLIWLTGLVNNNPALIIAVDNYAAMAYKKKPGVGSISPRTGTAAMYAFSMLPFKEGITRLMKFRNKTVNNTIIKSIDKVIAEVAAANGYDRDLVEEIGVMDFGLDDSGKKKLVIDNAISTISIDATNEVEVSWEKDGKPVKSVPAAIKSSHANALKEWKNEIKEIEMQLGVQKDRIESYYLQKKEWAYTDWMDNYIQHPLVKHIAAKLIWQFTNENNSAAGYYHNGVIISADAQPISWIDDNTRVELWHPVHSDTGSVLAWRNFIREKEITQPFKQAYREIYIVTDAELRTNTYSNRFAAHILRQHQFAALCKQRGWQYHLMGAWDSHNTPTLQVKKWQITAQYYIDADHQGTTNDAGIFNYIATDQVLFKKEGEQLQMCDIPPLVFTEVMRDVDLFVGVCSIGNDPEWSDSGDDRQNNYWRTYSFSDTLSESAEIRAEVLRSLIPRLRIAGQCSFDKKFLIVRGKLRTYKIHMGSGNILMEPNDQYLCIVPGSRDEKKEKVYLPFEGDRMLSIIISKALLLADDDKIKDVTITRQLEF